jgi:hypothetical protein
LVWNELAAEQQNAGLNSLSLIGAGAAGTMQPLLGLDWVDSDYVAGVANLQGTPPPVWTGLAAYSVEYQTLPALALVGGKPALLFSRSPEAELGYVRAQDADGTSWPAGVSSISLPYNTGFDSCSLVEAGGLVHAAGSANTGDLWYCRSQDPAGASWEAPMRLMQKKYNQLGHSVLLDSGTEPLLIFSLGSSIYCAHWE